MTGPIRVAVIGGGMITHDQLLPALYQLQSHGGIAEILVCARHAETLTSLAGSEVLCGAFPQQSFQAFPGLYSDAIASLPPGNIVVIAMPDQLHYEAIMEALRRNQHVIAVKPLVLTHAESIQIEREAYQRGLVVAIEYHKRFDDRSLMARRRYRDGLFGQFRLGTAALLEKWYYRESNFQNWCTTENSDAFTYIGCHYVDLVHFITGLLPTSVSVCGIEDTYPNGNTGYLWTDARVRWNNGAILNVQNAIGFPDAAPGSNTQGITMYCSGPNGGAWLRHDDQYRGLQYCYTRNPGGAGSTIYAEPSPDYFQYIDLGGPGLTPVGYGVRSVQFLFEQCRAAAQIEAIGERQKFLKKLDDAGLVATPGNSRYNEQVIEAGRLSIQQNGREIEIQS